LSKLKDYSVGYKTSDIGLKDYYPNTDWYVFITPWYNRIVQPLCKMCNIGSGWHQYRLHFELCIPVVWLWFPQFI